MRDRDIVSGVLGCPACGTRYPIERGVADFRIAARSEAQVGAHESIEGDRDTTSAVGSSRGAPDLALRAAALLDLAEPGGFVVLAGAWSSAAPALRDLIEHVHVFAVDALPSIESGGGISLARTGAILPLRAGSARGIALDAAHISDRYLASAVEALRARGRLVAPASIAVPAEITELARDERHWVGERAVPPSPIVQLTGRRGVGERPAP